MMLKNYFKTALRNIYRNKVFSFINISGLSIGIACSILILVYAGFEFSYDNFHANKDKIYKVVSVWKYGDNNFRKFALQPLASGDAMVEEIPGIDARARFRWGSGVVNSGGEAFNESLIMTDADVFDIFSFGLKYGNPSKALNSPNAIVINRDIAAKYFGSENPMGKNLEIELGGAVSQFTVTGVLEEIPENSSIKFNILLPMKAYPDYNSIITNWNSSRVETYLLLNKNTSAEQVSKSFSSFIQKHYAGKLESENEYQIELLKFEDAYFAEDVRFTQMEKGSLFTVQVLPAIAFLILLIASINYITISLSKSTARSKEVGLRKITGANNKQIFMQFIGEAFIFVFISVTIGFLIAELLLPSFNHLWNKNISSTHLLSTLNLSAGILLVIFLAFITGGYPAFVVSRFNPINALKETGTKFKNSILARGLITTQFVLSSTFIIGIIVMKSQFDYLNSADLGYNKDNLLAIETQTGWNTDGERRLENFKNELAKSTAEYSVSGTIYSFARGTSEEGWNENETERSAFVYRVDYDFIDAMNMKIISGRNFSRKYSTDSTSAVVVNETLVREFGIANPIGHKLTGFRNVQGLEEPTIVGVVKDFNFQSLYSQVSPVVLHVSQNWPINYLLVRLNPGNINRQIGELKTAWTAMAPNTPFDYSFVDEDLAEQYEKDQQWQTIVEYASILSILITCMGLIGLTSLNIVRRRKEIGIRKVLGSSSGGITVLLIRQYFVLMAAASIIAWPVTYYLLSVWLENFAYRTELNPSYFALGTLVTIGMAILAISNQAIKAALKNPVDSIRYE